MKDELKKYTNAQTEVAAIFQKGQADLRKIMATNQRAIDRRISLLQEELVTAMAAVNIHVRHESEPVRPDLRAKQIMVVVATHFDVTVEDIIGRSRDRQHTLPRKVAMYLVYKYVSRGQVWVSRQFDNRDHTTIQSACDSVNELIKRDHTLRGQIEIIEGLLGMKPVEHKPNPRKGKPVSAEQREKALRGQKERRERDSRRNQGGSAQ